MAEAPPLPAFSTPVLDPKKEMIKKCFQLLKENREEMVADKGGIEITSTPEAINGKVQLIMEHLGDLCTLRFKLLNIGTNGICFTYYTAMCSIRFVTLLEDNKVTRNSSLYLCPDDTYEVIVECTLNNYGHSPMIFYFEFCPDTPKSTPFYIIRETVVTARSWLSLELEPVAPYIRPKWAKRVKRVTTKIVPGVHPDSSGVHLRSKVKLKEYKYDCDLKVFAEHGLEDCQRLSSAAKYKLKYVRDLLSCDLNMNIYAERFHILLHLEEFKMESDVRKYSLHNQPMVQDRCNRELLKLNVPGVAENRPSVLRGDSLRLTFSEDKHSTTAYTGYVHRVELDSVTMGFSVDLVDSFTSNMRFDVEFTINRFPLRLQHRAVSLSAEHHLDMVLFPTGSVTKHFSQSSIRMFNYHLECNPEQYSAVQHILAGSSKPAPYLVFGPPGTGKTITLVEAITQIHRADPSAHILVSAPSNSACDLLFERLLWQMDLQCVYRMYAPSRDASSVSQNSLNFCNWDAIQNSFVFPEKKELMKHSILITTLVSAGRLVSGGIPVGHFTHVFVDEAGQATEPECVIAIAGLLHPENGQLVLAGDPHQLGPVLHSPLALHYGLGLSLLERLMTKNPLYQKSFGHFNSCFVTKLLRNYRSHPAILQIPNSLFYDNELKVFADLWDRVAFSNWEHLPAQGFPIIFHGVMGKDEQEANSPSFFNVTEIEVLVDYLIKLKQTQGRNGLPELNSSNIGIVTPYRKQVEKIRKALKSVLGLSGWDDIQVGSVEEFQGQERKVMILSTVRSSLNYVSMDQEFSIGFLSNKKRFNVAITRAKSLLIVVGNPVLLYRDPTWKIFIDYCLNKKGYTGFIFNDSEGKYDVDQSLRIVADLRTEVSHTPLEDKDL